MKNIFLSLAFNQDNQELLTLLDQEKEYKLVNDINEEGTIVIVNGPLTKLAHILTDNWHLKKNIEKIILVGGSTKYGDVTPVAESNIYSDPESAQLVFLSEVPIVMFGLNVTRDLPNKALCPLAYLKDESIFETEDCGVFVETKGTITRGMTVTDLYSDKQFEQHSVLMVKSIDQNKFNKMFK